MVSVRINSNENNELRILELENNVKLLKKKLLASRIENVRSVLECKNEIADLKYVMSGHIKDLANKVNRLKNENQSLRRSTQRFEKKIIEFEIEKKSFDLFKNKRNDTPLEMKFVPAHTHIKNDKIMNTSDCKCQNIAVEDAERQDNTHNYLIENLETRLTVVEHDCQINRHNMLKERCLLVNKLILSKSELSGLEGVIKSNETIMVKTPLKRNHIKQFSGNKRIEQQEDNIRLLENNLSASRMENIQYLQNNINRFVDVEKKSLSEIPWVLPQTVATTIAEEQDDIPKLCLTRKRFPLTPELLKILSERTTNVNKYVDNLKSDHSVPNKYACRKTVGRKMQRKLFVADGTSVEKMFK